MARIEPVFGNGGAAAIDSDCDDFEQEPLAPVYSRPQVFSFSGRLSLARYWQIHVMSAVVVTALLLFFGLGLREQAVMGILAGITILLPAFLLQISLLMRRARDLGWSPVWGVLAILLPLIGLLIALPLILLPGKAQANRHGACNPPQSLVVRVATGLLAITFIISAMAVPLYLPGSELAAIIVG